jgi:hypothetical protein
MTGEHFDIGRLVRAEQLHRDLPAKAVVGPERIAVAEQKNACHVAPPGRSDRLSYFVQKFTRRVQKLDDHWHFSIGMRRAAQTRIVSPDQGLHPIEHASGKALAPDKMFGDLMLFIAVVGTVRQ